nr:anther-specific proline-rich protein APG-like [Equus asinus]
MYNQPSPPGRPRTRLPPSATPGSGSPPLCARRAAAGSPRPAPGPPPPLPAHAPRISELRRHAAEPPRPPLSFFLLASSGSSSSWSSPPKPLRRAPYDPRSRQQLQLQQLERARAQAARAGREEARHAGSPRLGAGQGASRPLGGGLAHTPEPQCARPPST